MPQRYVETERRYNLKIGCARFLIPPPRPVIVTPPPGAFEPFNSGAAVGSSFVAGVSEGRSVKLTPSPLATQPLDRGRGAFVFLAGASFAILSLPCLVNHSRGIVPL